MPPPRQVETTRWPDIPNMLQQGMGDMGAPGVVNFDPAPSASRPLSTAHLMAQKLQRAPARAKLQSRQGTRRSLGDPRGKVVRNREPKRSTAARD
jgi:hypothetical protein